ncbi:hypothetical protein J1P26_18135 [Neobacillus sp. MM2021_6]|uniref:hypothetical protein n=1 Tax=Bacillaceae TaxID=186817 RepID=UPI00140DBCE1|nr:MULTISPECIES: hypothetical protein [Bacillaceae]MBO0961628.1 hypothetical protein [Neobacillus sp. MM2021_6]NHC19457.1 hypothetical protein [Bacillus sp. MM2020_4]
MIEGKGLGGKRVNRVGLSLTNEYETKLLKLATACNFRHHTTFANLLIEMCLDNAQLVSDLQKKYCTQSAYKIFIVNGEYVLSGREDIR